MKKTTLLAIGALAMLTSSCGGNKDGDADTNDSVAQINIDSTTIVISVDSSAQNDSAISSTVSDSATQH
ncbi:MAG: hypothetical protein J6C81_04170 [Muribaculaceae bacterium]|nr:hypothetical protein [Muribaculaceae bacterium]